MNLLSPECHDLLDKIFVVDPKRRITIPQIMEHPFYKEFLTDGNKARGPTPMSSADPVYPHNELRGQVPLKRSFSHVPCTPPPSHD